MKVYIATSWKNTHTDDVVKALQRAGHFVYDFRVMGFKWMTSEAIPAERHQHHLGRHDAKNAYKLDKQMLEECDAVVMVLPCGRSAHLELGWAIGMHKKAIIYMPEPEHLELMYSGVKITGNLEELVRCVSL